jgi:hypothetical protein
MKIGNIEFIINPCLSQTYTTGSQNLVYDEYEISIDWPEEITQDVIESWPEEISESFTTEYSGTQQDLITVLWQVDEFLKENNIEATITAEVFCWENSWLWFIHDVIHAYFDTNGGATTATTTMETTRIAQQIVYAYIVGQPLNLIEVADYVALCQIYMKQNLLHDFKLMRISPYSYSFLNVTSEDIIDFTKSAYFASLFSQEMTNLLARIPMHVDTIIAINCLWLLPWTTAQNKYWHD